MSYKPISTPAASFTEQTRHLNLFTPAETWYLFSWSSFDQQVDETRITRCRVISLLRGPRSNRVLPHLHRARNLKEHTVKAKVSYLHETVKADVVRPGLFEEYGVPDFTALVNKSNRYIRHGRALKLKLPAKEDKRWHRKRCPVSSPPIDSFHETVGADDQSAGLFAELFQLQPLVTERRLFATIVALPNVSKAY